ncbi:hypothetical protein HanXRQr2_Chr05g0200801 [Helianthus annuus]|uniref:Uncharacterized protein n=1 Tax=Helianthus annuus TaxID=4232 RepID=A0A9K3IXA4_HELAN|nr:hypothetical protein HanXRQr2_Chr05g0200801 [Helianthus annuus]
MPIEDKSSSIFATCFHMPGTDTFTRIKLHDLALLWKLQMTFLHILFLSTLNRHHHFASNAM